MAVTINSQVAGTSSASSNAKGDVLGPAGNTIVGNKAKQAQRLANKATKTLGAMAQAPAWPATTAILEATVYRLPTNELVISDKAGTTGAVAPTFSATGPMNDGTTTWWSLGQSTAAPLAGLPLTVVSVTDNAGASGNTLYNFDTNADVFESFSTPYRDATGSGSTRRTLAYNITDGTTNANGYSTASGYQGKVCIRRFKTASQVIDLGYFAIVAGFKGENIQVLIDGIPISESLLVPGAAGGSRYFRITLSGPKKEYTYTIVSKGTFYMSYVGVSAGETVTLPSARGLLLGCFDDSYGDTESPAVDNQNYDLNYILASSLGYDHVIHAGVGGTSYSVDAFGRKNLNQLLDLNNVAAFNMDAIFVGHGFNAIISQPAATEAAAALSSWQKLRAAAPSAPIVIAGIWYRKPGSTANADTLHQLLLNTFLAWRDPNSVFINPMDGTTVLYDGSFVGSGTTWFNSGNISWALPAAGGIYDGAHPSPTGKNMLLTVLTNAVNTGLTTLGY